MKICYLGQAKSPIVRSWAEHFARDHEIHLLTDNYSPIPGVTVHQIGWQTRAPGFGYLSRVRDTRRLLRELKPDVVHAHYVFGYGTMAAEAGANPLVITSMGSDIGAGAENSWLVRRGIRYAFERCAVLAVKDDMAKERAIQLGCPADRIVISRSCCDTKLFCPDAASWALRWQLGTNSCHTVIYTRPFNSYYNALDLGVAMLSIMEHDPDVKFIIVEHGDLIDGWKEHLKLQPWKDRVIFVPRIPHEDMPRYLASADIYLDTFYPKPDVAGHGHGTNLIEAMSCGCAQVLPDRLEYVEGWCKADLYQRGNSVDLARVIVALLKDDTKRKQLSRLSRAAAAEFDQERVMGDMLKVYQRLIARKVS